MPERFDLGNVLASEVRKRLPGKTCGHPDAQTAGDELQEGEARGCIQPIQKLSHRAAHFRLAERVDLAHDFAEARIVRLGQIGVLAGIPDKRNRFGQIADIVVGVAEQDLVHALQNEFAKQGRFDAFQIEGACNRRKPVSAIGIGRITEVIRQKRQLAVSGGCEDKTVEKGRKSFHAQSPSSS